MTICLMVLHTPSRYLPISKKRMNPSKILSSERKRTMAAPETQMNRPCCCSSQKRNARRAGEEEKEEDKKDG